MTTQNQHPGTVLVIVALALLGGVALLFAPESAPVRPTGQPRPAAWEVKAWADSHCDRCGKGLTANPEDGTYIIGRQPYWLHKGCVAAVVKAARR